MLVDAYAKGKSEADWKNLSIPESVVRLWCKNGKATTKWLYVKTE